MKKLLIAMSMVGTSLSGLAVTPALAQRGGYYDRSYDESRNQDYQYESHDRAYAQAYDEGYNRDPDVYVPEQRYYRPAQANHRRYSRSYRDRCTSGTTGAIIGGVVGGLLGREIGRGGYYNRPSTTGLILGAGGGALAGRAIERDGCR